MYCLFKLILTLVFSGSVLVVRVLIMTVIYYVSYVYSKQVSAKNPPRTRSVYSGSGHVKQVRDGVG